MSCKNYTIEQVKEAIKNSVSWRDAIFKIGLNGDAGGNSVTIKKIADENNFDYSHFKGSAWAKGKIRKSSITPLSDLLVMGRIIKSSSIKDRIIKEGLLKNECCFCGLKNEWNGKKLILQLDHKDGNRSNNLLENLRLLCPNCHSQTKTYCRKCVIIKTKKYCKKCNKEIKKSLSGLCSKCFNKTRDYSIYRKCKRPEKNILLQQVAKLGYSQTGKIYGVSNTSIKKWLKAAGVVELADT